MEKSTPSERTVELWIRSFAPAATGSAGERAVERARRLEEDGPLESVRIRGWGKEIRRDPRPDRVPRERTVNDRLDAFEAWADRAGRSLEPYFRTRRVDSTLTDEVYSVCHLPTVALAEYADGDLVHLAPSRKGERTVEVSDRLDALAAGRAEGPVSVDRREVGRTLERGSDGGRPERDAGGDSLEGPGSTDGLTSPPEPN